MNLMRSNPRRKARDDKPPKYFYGVNLDVLRYMGVYLPGAKCVKRVERDNKRTNK